MNNTKNTKITGRAVYVNDNGDLIERGFSFDDLDGFAQYLNDNMSEIAYIEFIK